jgi:hypothetical protein
MTTCNSNLEVDFLYFFSNIYFCNIGYLWGFGCGGLMMAHKVRLYSKWIIIRQTNVTVSLPVCHNGNVRLILLLT